MTLLLIDDDGPVLQDLQNRLDWAGLGFERVFTAQSAREAWELIHRVPVDVVVCDIEMPGRSGLELLGELHGEFPDLPCIVLTSYARFEYAQKAVQLDIVEYLLKPVETQALRGAVQKAAALSDHRSRLHTGLQYGQYWLDERRNAAEYFWLKTATGGAELRSLPEKLDYRPEDLFYPVVLQALTSDDLPGWDASMLEYAVKNVCYEFFETEYLHPHCVAQLSKHRWLVILSVVQGPATDAEPLDERLEEFHTTVQNSLHLDLCCGVGQPVPYGKVRGEVQAIVAMLEDRFDRAGGVLHTTDSHTALPYQTPEISLWETLLQQNDRDGLLHQIEQYLRGHAAGMNREGMLAFRQDVVQMVYTCLKQKGIQAHRLFGGAESNRLYQAATYSIEDMLAYCRMLVSRSIEYANLFEQPEGIVGTVRAYLDEHYTEELQRTDLAGLVYVSPDYLSRLFKKETGRSLMQYVTDKRMDAACRLLTESSLAINAVAMQVGYQSFAYFSKIFRETKGMTPMAWRKQHKK